MIDKKLYRKTHCFATLIIIVGLPYSTAAMSIGGILLSANYLLEGDYKTKWNRLKENKIALLFLGVYGLHIIGLLHTSDFTYALKDLRIKLPLLFMPIVYGSTPPFSGKFLRQLLNLFIAASLFALIIGLFSYYEFIPSKTNVEGMRKHILFGNHIRLGLFLALSILILLVRLIEHNKKHFSLILIVFCFSGLLFFQLTSGLVTAMTGLVAVLLYYVFKTKKGSLRWSIISLVILIPLSIFVLLNNQYNQYNYLADEPLISNVKTASGNDYIFNAQSYVVENNHRVYCYLNEQEVITTWNQKTGVPKINNSRSPLYQRVIRYLSSKGIRKDKEGVEHLSDQEIQNIIEGAANYKLAEMYGWQQKLQEYLFEWNVFRSGGNVNGNSMTQRFIYWKLGWTIFQDNAIIGIGTGDVKQAFEKQYLQNDYGLSEKNQRRAHNQYITFALTFGILGLLYIVFAFSSPLLLFSQAYKPLFIGFLTVILISFLWEDTLESQMGITFCTVFLCLFSFGQNEETSSIVA